MRKMRPGNKTERSFVAFIRNIVSAMALLANKCIMPLIRERYSIDDGNRIDPFIGDFNDTVNNTKESFLYYGEEAREHVGKQVSAGKKEISAPAVPKFIIPYVERGKTPFENQLTRVVKDKVEKAAEESTEAVRYQINAVVGVDMGKMMQRESLNDYISAAVSESVMLIKTIPDRFFSDISRIVLDGYRSGTSLKQLSKSIQEVYNVHDFTAARIARDQICKITSDVTIKRMKEAGIKRFKWTTSGDNRVTGNPAGLYPRAKVKCYDIARRDIGYGPGVYLISEGAEVNGQKGVYPGRAHIMDRCVATALIEGIDY